MRRARRVRAIEVSAGWLGATPVSSVTAPAYVGGVTRAAGSPQQGMPATPCSWDARPAAPPASAEAAPTAGWDLVELRPWSDHDRLGPSAVDDEEQTVALGGHQVTLGLLALVTLRVRGDLEDLVRRGADAQAAAGLQRRVEHGDPRDVVAVLPGGHVVVLAAGRDELAALVTRPFATGPSGHTGREQRLDRLAGTERADADRGDPVRIGTAVRLGRLRARRLLGGPRGRGGRWRRPLGDRHVGRIAGRRAGAGVDRVVLLR